MVVLVVVRQGVVQVLHLVGLVPALVQGPVRVLELERLGSGQGFERWVVVLESEG